MAKKKIYTIRKYDGDDRYSWAIFYANEVKGKPSQLFYGDANPVRTGLDRHSAQYQRDKLEEEAAEKFFS